MQSTPTTPAARLCGCGRGHAVAILSYLFPGATRRNHYHVCVGCYADYSRDNLVAVRYL